MGGYAVKELYHTLQGEGARAGRAAVFLRFAGCNLWSGREADRAAARCTFCDTDFVGVNGPGGGRFADAAALADAVTRTWTEAAGAADGRYVVCTGGEPLLQLDAALIAALHAAGFEIAVETNGTIVAPAGIDWITVSPKTADFVQRTGHELKLVLGQNAVQPDDVVHLPFVHRYLQPMDGPRRDDLTAEAVRRCRRDPRWRLSLQTHKLIGIP